MKVLLILSVFLMVISCKSQDGKMQISEKEYLQKGAEITKVTQAELLKNVSAAMKKGGPVYAIEFCNLKAMVLKDSLSKVHKSEIRRVSSKYRNPVDMPQSDSEKKQIHAFEQAFQKNDSLKSTLHVFADRIEYYQPIMVANETCLKCHGTPESQVSAETMAALSARYPQDNATGYTLNDFRGMWKVTFSR